MNAQAWIALAALVVTLLTGLIIAVFRAAVLLTNVRRDIGAIKLDLSDIRTNHLAHIEKDLEELRTNQSNRLTALERKLAFIRDKHLK